MIDKKNPCTVGADTRDIAKSSLLATTDRLGARLPAGNDYFGDRVGHIDNGGYGVVPPQAALPVSPSLSINHNSTETVQIEGVEKGLKLLKGSCKKSAEKLFRTSKDLCLAYGVEKVGFLTLTFPFHITNTKEASRYFNTLRTHVLSQRYEQAIVVLERQKSGRIHYHLLVVLKDDIRTGANFEEFKRQVYSSANKALRAEWTFWRKVAPAYHFGRTELLPIRSTGEAIGRYVGKYIGKHLESRQEGDKGAKLVRYIGFKPSMSCQFSWATPGGWVFRKKLELFAKSFGITNHETLCIWAKDRFGSRWMWHLNDSILAMEIPFAAFPTVHEYNAYVNGGGVLSKSPVMGVDRPIEWFSGLNLRPALTRLRPPPADSPVRRTSVARCLGTRPKDAISLW